VNEESLRAQLRAAAWGLASIIGLSKAVKIIKQIAAELENEQWPDL
jgi:hypothetical protein